MNDLDRDLKLLEDVLKDCNIFFEDAKDGISRINNMTIDEYAKTISRDDISIKAYNDLFNIVEIPSQDIRNIEERSYEDNIDYENNINYEGNIDYEDNIELSELILAA